MGDPIIFAKSYTTKETAKMVRKRMMAAAAAAKVTKLYAIN